MTKVKITKSANAKDLESPFYATEHSAGLDLSAATEGDVIIGPGEIKLIPTGISVELPDGLEMQIRPRSGLALKHGLTVLNSPGTIDSDYRGEIKVILINHGKEKYKIERGSRIAQAVIAKYVKISWEESENLAPSLRSEGGFGSTGVK